MAGGLNNFMSILGGLGQGLEKAPAAMEQAQQIKLQQQKMEDDRLTQATTRIGTLVNLGAQLPTLTTSPGWQSAVEKSFGELGVDKSALPRKPDGSLDISGFGNSQLAEIMKKPEMYKAVQGTPVGDARQALYSSWNLPGTAPDYFLKGIPYKEEVSAGFNAAITNLVDGVRKGGDVTSAVDQLQAMNATGQFGSDPATVDKYVKVVMDAAASPQAKIAIAKNQAEYDKVVQEVANAVRTGKEIDSTTKKNMADLGLIAAQTQFYHGQGPVQAAEVGHYGAASSEAIAQASHMGVETQKDMILVQQMQHNLSMGIPIDTSDFSRAQTISASLSNQINQWTKAKTAAAKELQQLTSDVNFNISGDRQPNPNYDPKAPPGSANSTKFIPNATDQQAFNTLHQNYQTANDQLVRAMQRQARLAPILNTPNGTRPFTTGHDTPGYTRMKVYSVRDVKTGKTVQEMYTGGDVNDPNSWTKPAGGSTAGPGPH